MNERNNIMNTSKTRNLYYVMDEKEEIYEIAIPPKRRVDYLKICEAYFKISSHQNADVYDVYFFVNR